MSWEPSDARPDAGSIGGCCAVILAADLVGLACFALALAWLIGWL